MIDLADSPSVQALNNQWGSVWRKDPGKAQYYCTQKMIIDEIISCSSHDQVSEKAVRLLKTQQNGQCMKSMSLNAFQKALKLARRKKD